MKKIAAVLMLALLLTPGAEANPFSAVKNKVEHFARNHPGFTAAAITLTVTSIYSFKTTEYCRATGYDVERCTMHYGSPYQFNTGVTAVGVGMLFAGEACKKDQPGWKFCDGLQYAVPAAQTITGTHDIFHRGLEKDK